MSQCDFKFKPFQIKNEGLKIRVDEFDALRWREAEKVAYA